MRLSIRLSTSRPPITSDFFFGIAGSGSGESSTAGDSSEMLLSLLILSVDESEDRVDEQLEDLFPVASGMPAASESDVEDDGSGELAVGLSTSSVGVVGGEDGFLISSESRELTPLDSLPTGETSCFLPWLPAAATPRQSTLSGEIGDSSPKPSIRSPTVANGTAMFNAIIQNRFVPACFCCGSGLAY